MKVCVSMPGYLLTTIALQQLHFAWELGEPLPVCSIREAELHDLSDLELLLRMEQEGWVWQRLPKHIPEPFRTDPQNAKKVNLPDALGALCRCGMLNFVGDHVSKAKVSWLVFGEASV